MINKQVIALCILLGMSFNAKALDFKIVQGDGQCPSGYTLATPQQARSNQTSACGVLGRWYITRLAGGGSMDGLGYNCKIRNSDTRKLGHSLCIHIQHSDIGSIFAKKPVYVIAHRINDADEIEEALDKGANAVELDVRWGRITIFNKRNWYVDHDGVYVWSTKLKDWLKECQRLHKDKPNLFKKLALIIFDIKTPKQLLHLRSKVRETLPHDLNVIYSVGNYNDRYKLIVLKDGLKTNEGLAIDYKASPTKVRNFFVEKGVDNFWYGDGICAGCIEPNRVSTNISNAVKMRNDRREIKGVYTWTYAAYERILFYIQDKDVDGILVNMGGNAQTIGDGISDAIKIIANDPTRRLANRLDNAFK